MPKSKEEKAVAKNPFTFSVLQKLLSKRKRKSKVDEEVRKALGKPRKS
jgi:hypothetical protein